MIRRIEAFNYRCLKKIDCRLDDFQILVGQNASGKTTFLDVVTFLGDLVRDGLDAAIDNRTSNFHDLVWGRKGDRFELSIESEIPEKYRSILEMDFSLVRYEISFGLSENGELCILAERGVLKNDELPTISQEKLIFPDAPPDVSTILSHVRNPKFRTVFSKVLGKNDNYYSETYKEKGKGWKPSMRLGPRRSTLGNLPEDESNLPVSTWLKNLLAEGVQQIVLNSQLIKRASPPGQARQFKPDGSNLAWVVQKLKDEAPERFSDWVRHVRSTLPDIVDIRTVLREEDRHRYIMVKYDSGLDAPSWMLSDGTLRMLALTIIAYMPDFSGVYLIEEPENGIHPGAVQAVFASLQSVYDAQILLATHSPVILSMAEARQVLCFAKTKAGYVDIVRGDRHPNLREWQGETNLGELFAGGVLG